MPRVLIAIILLTLSCLFAACAHMWGRNKSQRSSSIAEYLYPEKEAPLITPSMPVLNLPLRVGIAFVPTVFPGQQGISEMQKKEVLERVAAKFKDQVFIKTIETIPTSYFRSRGSFANLKQVSRMFSLDVIVLLSYDQVQFTGDNLLSLSYWTIVGAYVFNGNKNDTQTLVEAAVYDIRSESLLFRAPGSSRVESNSSGIKTNEKQRSDAAKSMTLATDDLVANLDVELESFKKRVKEGNANVKIEHREGYTGGGSLGVLFALVFAAVGIASQWKRR